MAWVRALLALAASLVAIGCLAGVAAAQPPYVTIGSTGPLTSIAIGSELSCQVRFLGDADLELYPPDAVPGDCGTLIAVDGSLFAPDFRSHSRGDRTDYTATSSLGAYTPFTPVAQTAVAGSGTSPDPFTVRTEVRLGDTGLRVVQVDRYVRRDAAYRTDVTIVNEGAAPRRLVLYRAGDCFLQESDLGFGFVGRNKSVACARTPDNRPPDRTEQWLPITGDNQFYEAHYDDLWRWIGSKRPFPDRCRCGTRLDNGAGLSWRIAVPPGASVTRAHFTSFSAQGVVGTPRSRDTTPPQVVFTDVPRGCTERNFTARIFIFDANPLRRVRVYVDGRLVRRTKAATVTLRIEAANRRAGRHRIRVAAVDARGNGRSRTRTWLRCRTPAPTFTG